MKKILLLVCFAITTLYVNGQEQKMTASEIAVFTNVSASASAIRTLKADFIQYKHMSFLSKDIETSGKIIFKEPDVLQWQYKKPYNYSILFRKGKILINDEGKKSAMDAGSSKIFTKINKLIVGTVNGDLFDEKEFSISYFKTALQNGARLVPRDAAIKKYIKTIELLFDKDDATVSQVKLIESAEDYTRILFKNKVLNAKIDDTTFIN